MNFAKFGAMETLPPEYDDVDPEYDEVDNATRQRIQRDFEEWSGGFPPESEWQITVYLDYALNVEIDREVALSVLQSWASEENLGPPSTQPPHPRKPGNTA